MKNSLLFALILVSSALFSQEKGLVSGTVFDAELNNEPMLFANISLKGTQLQTRTNIFGNFEIDGIEPGNHVLHVTFAGYESQELPITVLAGNTTIMQTEIHALTLPSEELAKLGFTSNIQEENKSFTLGTMPNN